MPSIAVIGAGPIGLEAARQSIEQGWSVTVFEQGRIADAIHRWGYVKMFSPREWNSTPGGRTAIDYEVPLEECESGDEFATGYLEPLARWIESRAEVLTGTRVRGISRSDWLKGDRIGERSGQPFRLLIETADQEAIHTSDIVLDCSGVFSTPSRAGAGGICCPGERSNADLIEYGVPTASRFATIAEKKRVLVLGSGYSAATMVSELLKRAGDQQAEVIWSTRSCRPEGPLIPIPDDSLPARNQLSLRANRLVSEPSGPVRWLAETVVDSVVREGEALGVRLRNLRTQQVEELVVDHVLACTGFRPDRELARELQIHECYATEGPIKLAAELIGQSGGDCTQVTSSGVGVLVNPEGDYFILGAKSYGRSSRFLLQNGYAQVTAVIRLLASRSEPAGAVSTGGSSCAQ
ncbi:hypothetical protein [Rubinisphaera margarita]|uniref:hypothetical protein n=1 Tax=Rubinisphaera margarita TaxID=2909586 RepID=UPI001EE900D7|nr:hypothetical protein [Rubinisphaera margarita]MCG6154220.1 hypothetical protein [Rubinisphaera margarita]